MLGLCFSIWSAVEDTLPIALPHLLVVPVFGFALAQTTLLVFWAMFSSAGWCMRLGGATIGSVYLELSLHIGGQEGDHFRFLATMTAFGVTAAFLGIPFFAEVSCR